MEPKKPSSRQVKNPETFRERALKATDAQDNPKDSYRMLKAPIVGLKIIFRPIAAGIRRLKKVKALKPLFVVLGFIGHILVPKYFRTSYAELKRVTWPSMRQSIKLTYAVLVFAIIFGSAVALVDYGLDKVFKTVLLK